MDKRVRELCFKGAQAVDLGKANRQHWYLVTGSPDPKCAAEGDRAAARLYAPPDEAFKYR
jgi:hypothetical protein